MIGRGKKPNRECEAGQRFRIERSFPCCMSDSEKATLPEPRSLCCQAEARTTVGTCPRESWGQEGRGCPLGARFHRKQGKKERELPWLLPSSASSSFAGAASYCFNLSRIKEQEPVRAEPGQGGVGLRVGLRPGQACSSPEMKRNSI